MLIVRGAIKDYDWGVLDGLARWAGPTGGPQAELWFGVHPGGPSPLLGDDWQPTGEHLGDKFDIEAIPLLVKLLAAARPLSVQVHPRRDMAEAGYHAQQPGGPRIFSDPFEKTELLVALEPFEAFSGWRDAEEAIAMLAYLADSCGAQTSQAIAHIEVGDLHAAVRSLLDVSDADAIASLADAAQHAGLDDAAVNAYRTVTQCYPDDRGALVTVLLGHLSLQVGEAVFVPAGVPHSYIRGLGLEVMSSSDNVIRLGLTSKPVFVDEALEAIDLDVRPEIVRTHLGDLIWPVNSPFVVRLIRKGRERIPAGAYRILVLIEGSATVESEVAGITLRPGTAAVLGAEDPDAHVHANGLVAIVQSTER